MQSIDQWTEVSRKGQPISPVRIVQSVDTGSATVSPNNFVILANVNEEGINEEEDKTVVPHSHKASREEGEVSELETEEDSTTSTTTIPPQKKNSRGGHRSRSKGPLKSIVSRKESGLNKNTSSRK